MINVMVLPAAAMAGQNVSSDTLVISIVSPNVQHPVIHGEHVYQFHFHDVIEEYFLENRNRIVRPMEYEIAESIVEICMNHRDKKRWIIHCEAGISRSPGVAIGLARYLQTTPTDTQLEESFPMYNNHVRKMIQYAMENKLKEIFMNMKMRLPI